MRLIANKRFALKYTLRETFGAGIELSGQEVKALRARLGSLEGARIVVRGGEAFVIGMSIPPYQSANAPEGYDAEQTRRLLLSKKEIGQLADAESTKGLTIIPIELYTVGRYVKIRVAIVRGKKGPDRREELKQRDANRERAHVLKNR